MRDRKLTSSATAASRTSHAASRNRMKKAAISSDLVAASALYTLKEALDAMGLLGAPSLDALGPALLTPAAASPASYDKSRGS